MQLINLSLVALLSSYVAAQDIDDNDVPSECRSICASVVTLTTDCDQQNNDNDSGFINCVCTAPNAASEIVSCEACVANFDRNDGHDNDVNDFIRSCSFTTTPYTSTAIATGSSATTTSSGNAFTTLSGTLTSSLSSTITGSASSIRESLSSALSSASASNSGAVASLSSALGSVTSAAASATPTNAASGMGVQVGGVLGALVVGVLGLA